MPLTCHSGSILDDPADVLVVPVNSRAGIMGAGLAKAFAARFPGLKDIHRAAVNDGFLGPGGGFMVWINPPPEGGIRGVYLLATKDHWKDPSRLSWVASGLQQLERHIERVSRADYLVRVRSVAIPALGCGLGGLKWSEVRPLIEGLAGRVQGVEWRVYGPKATQGEKQ